ncbi:MAG: hypothetical protein NVV73_15150 [Cellvibrionaceae bacterium]|nr:hypothetical protein [Cellvibrionaceae bacterium]
MSLEEWRTVFSGATLISVVFVALNYWMARGKVKSDSELAQDKEICQQAILAIERAFEALSGDGEVESPPEPDRLNWLTASRQILKFKNLKSRLKTELYKLVCSEHEEHWRHKFYLLLDKDSLSSPSYFQGADYLPISSENIDPTSALVIFNFMQWNPNQPDPLSDVNKDEIIGDGYTLNGLHGFKRYLEILREQRADRSENA